MAQKISPTTYRTAMNPKTGKKGIVSFDSRTGSQKTIDSGKKPIKEKGRVKLMPIRKPAKGRNLITKAGLNPFKGSRRQLAGAAEEGKQEALQDSAQRKVERESRSLGRTPKAKNLTRLMRKGYRKGYRVKSTRGGSRR